MPATTCRQAHSIDAMETYIAVRTGWVAGAIVREDVLGTSDYAEALVAARAQRVHSAPHQYGVVDVRYACGCRGHL